VNRSVFPAGSQKQRPIFAENAYLKRYIVSRVYSNFSKAEFSWIRVF
jgi:hypothetical protein